MKFLVLTVLLLAIPIGFAHGPSTEEIMNNMMQAQNVSDLDDLDCSKVAISQMEFLGDAVMERMIGSDEFHEQMDVMMGGEGSESLGRIHFSIGSNWLGCDNTGNNMMTGSSMMGPMMMRMMGNYYPAYYNGFDSVLVLGLIGWILFVVILIYHLRLNKHKGRRRP